MNEYFYIIILQNNIILSFWKIFLLLLFISKLFFWFKSGLASSIKKKLTFLYLKFISFAVVAIILSYLTAIEEA
jgi:hypothetical protein